jgi:hypothetical protein
MVHSNLSFVNLLLRLRFGNHVPSLHFVHLPLLLPNVPLQRVNHLCVLGNYLVFLSRSRVKLLLLIGYSAFQSFRLAFERLVFILANI